MLGAPTAEVLRGAGKVLLVSLGERGGGILLPLLVLGEGAAGVLLERGFCARCCCVVSWFKAAFHFRGGILGAPTAAIGIANGLLREVVVPALLLGGGILLSLPVILGEGATFVVVALADLRGAEVVVEGVFPLLLLVD